MSVKTIPFTKLLQKTADVFELIVAMAKRARQVNQLRVAKYPLPTYTDGEDESFNETPDEEEMLDWDKIEKPTTIALDEMLKTDVEYRYASPEEEQSEQDETTEE